MEQVLFDTVNIGSQDWKVRNLDVAYFQNGDAIPEAQSDEEWEKAGENNEPAWCHYENKPENGIKYGKLYNWFAVNDIRGLCPSGWHVPSDKEWDELINYFGREHNAGGKLKSTMGWNDPNRGATNASGFTALPGGYRHLLGRFSEVGLSGIWWSTTVEGSWMTWCRSINNNSERMYRYQNHQQHGFSVRCVRD